MRLQNLHPDSLEDYLKSLGPDSQGLAIMRKKGRFFCFKIAQIPTPAAMILKQEAIACGGDFALPREAILCQSTTLEGILIATQSSLERLIYKCRQQPFGLKKLAESLKSHLASRSSDLKIMGVINANEESFYSKSRFLGDAALARIIELIAEGADIIDIGAASTRPGSEWVSEEEELKRIAPIAQAIAHEKLHEKVRFSIDTYHAKVAGYCLDRGFEIINDITALRSPEMVSLASERQVDVIIMHMQGDSPKEMQQNPHYENVVLEVEDFFRRRLESLAQAGITKITLDVGIGFGKNLTHNLKLIRHLGHFKQFGLPLLMGASRKSLIHAIMPTPTEERLPGTLILHAESYKAGANIIRCHDVKEHRQAFSVLEALWESEA